MRVLLFFITLLSISGLSLAQSFDLVIKNGKIIDGSGNSWYYGDVGVSQGKITFIGKKESYDARKMVDATGLIVAPGFIDVHAHIEGSEMTVPSADNFIFDGVTSVVTGNCGGANHEVDRYFTRVDSVRTSINIATLSGHNTVRRAVLGDVNREPSVDEQSKMESLVEK